MQLFFSDYALISLLYVLSFWINSKINDSETYLKSSVSKIIADVIKRANFQLYGRILPELFGKTGYRQQALWVSKITRYE